MYEQIDKLRQNLKKGHLLCSHDFTKNITCYSQQEVQAGFYDHTLVTLHPSVGFYTCDGEQCQSVVRHEIIHLSPILKHDSNAFKKFHCDTVKIVENSRGLSFQLVINVTDQAPSQYKNKNSFMHTSEYDRPVLHVYMGNRHGKLYSDQAAGRFLQFLRRAIANGSVHIACAKDIAEFAEKHYVY